MIYAPVFLITLCGASIEFGNDSWEDDLSFYYFKLLVQNGLLTFNGCINPISELVREEFWGIHG